MRCFGVNFISYIQQFIIGTMIRGNLINTLCYSKGLWRRLVNSPEWFTACSSVSLAYCESANKFLTTGVYF